MPGSWGNEKPNPPRLYGLVPNAELIPGKQQETKLGLEGLASQRRELRWTWKDGVGLDKQTLWEGHSPKGTAVWERPEGA